ncbi:hypothetical protein Zmor_006022 [Zophobas morio]|uniref:Uncharacterized protein n=1 Tax=Zophobas morio TaxID=2755281 RepID=A0AA38IYR2_9CUCU|nr:hypothetical protein Zmor_006022 [Zophobas morio]
MVCYKHNSTDQQVDDSVPPTDGKGAESHQLIIYKLQTENEALKIELSSLKEELGHMKMRLNQQVEGEHSDKTDTIDNTKSVIDDLKKELLDNFNKFRNEIKKL